MPRACTPLAFRALLGDINGVPDQKTEVRIPPATNMIAKTPVIARGRLMITETVDQIPFSLPFIMLFHAVNPSLDYLTGLVNDGFSRIPGPLRRPFWRVCGAGARSEDNSQALRSLDR